MQSIFQIIKKRDADANRTDRRGSRNTLRLSRADRVVRPYIRSGMSRISYVKYSTGAHVTTRIFYRALREPDSTVARRAFGLRKAERKNVKWNELFFCASALFSRPAPLFCILFSGKTEKSMPAERQLQRRCKNGTSVNAEKSSAPPARLFFALRAKKARVLRARLCARGTPPPE